VALASRTRRTFWIPIVAGQGHVVRKNTISAIATHYCIDACVPLTFTDGTAPDFANQSGNLAMPRRIVLSVFALALTAMTARAVGLPTHSRL
jgi:hypothetical protein